MAPALFTEIAAKVAARQVRVEVENGEYAARYTVLIPNTDTTPHGEAAVLAHAEAAGARGHLTYFAPNVVMADPIRATEEN